MFRKMLAALACASLLSACSSQKSARPAVQQPPPGTGFARTVNPSRGWFAAAEAQLEKYERPTSLSGEVVLQIVVDRLGRIVSDIITRSSGVHDLDREALAIIARAGSLPPPPREVPGDPIILTAHIRFERCPSPCRAIPRRGN
jgi:periplasmic protein TonB